MVLNDDYFAPDIPPPRCHKPDEEEYEGEVVYDKEWTEELQKFREWLSTEPFLSKDVDEDFIITFLAFDDTVEAAEERYMNYFYARQSLPKIFHDRHPCSPNNMMKYDAVCVVPLTSPLDKDWIILHTWLAHDDPDKFSPYHQAKLLFTELDILLAENQVKDKTISIIMDMKNFTKAHVDKITCYSSFVICRLFTHCFPAKFNGIFLINTSEVISDYTALFAPFDFHIIEEIDDLGGFLPKCALTADLGGDCEGPVREELFHPFFKRLQKCGNWLAYQDWRRHREHVIRMCTTRKEYGLAENPFETEEEKLEREAREKEEEETKKKKKDKKKKNKKKK